MKIILKNPLRINLVISSLQRMRLKKSTLMYQEFGEIQKSSYRKPGKNILLQISLLRSSQCSQSSALWRYIHMYLFQRFTSLSNTSISASVSITTVCGSAIIQLQWENSIIFKNNNFLPDPNLCFSLHPILGWHKVNIPKQKIPLSFNTSS